MLQRTIWSICLNSVSIEWTIFFACIRILQLQRMQLYPRACKTEHPPPGNFHTSAINMSHTAKRSGQQKARGRTINTRAVRCEVRLNRYGISFAQNLRFWFIWHFFSPIWVLRSQRTHNVLGNDANNWSEQSKKRWIPTDFPLKIIIM